ADAQLMRPVVDPRHPALTPVALRARCDIAELRRPASVAAEGTRLDLGAEHPAPTGAPAVDIARRECAAGEVELTLCLGMEDAESQATLAVGPAEFRSEVIGDGYRNVDTIGRHPDVVIAHLGLSARIGDLVHQSRRASRRDGGPDAIAQWTNERQSRLNRGEFVIVIHPHPAAKHSAENGEFEVEPGRGLGGGVIVVACHETAFLARPDHVAQVSAGEITAEPYHRTIVEQLEGAVDLAADPLVLVVEIDDGATRGN